MLKSVQTHFTDPHKPSCGHYMNKHTKERLLKRKLEAEVCSRDSATLTYNLLYIPRILKTDLRRQYPVMFMNVYNSCDYVYMKKFMDKFFRQDCEFLVEAAGKFSFRFRFCLIIFMVFNRPSPTSKSSI